MCLKDAIGSALEGNKIGKNECTYFSRALALGLSFNAEKLKEK